MTTANLGASLLIRTNAFQKSTLQRAADARQMNVSEFVLQASLREAERIIATESIIHLSAEEFQWTLDLMDIPPTPMARLRQALQETPAWSEDDL